MNQKQLAQIKKVARKYLKDVKDTQHGFDHTLRVKQNALKIADVLGVKDDIDPNLLQAACFLHDMTYSKQNTLPSALKYIFEGTLARKTVFRIVEPLDMANWEKEMIVKAISKHSKSFPFKKLNRKEDLYTKILQDADTLDFFYEQRVDKFQNINKFTKAAFPLINWIICSGRKNLDRFLNFPKLALYFPLSNALTYLEWKSLEHKSNTEILLCLHGYLDNSSMFAPLAEMTNNRFRVVALDLPMRSKNKICSIAELADYLENFRKKKGFEKFTLVGFSLGGLVGIEYSIKYPNRVNSLFLLNSLPCFLLNSKSKKIFKYIKPLFLLKPVLHIYSRLNTSKTVRKFLSKPVLTREQLHEMKYRYQPIVGTFVNCIDYCKAGEFNKLPLPKTVALFRDDEVLRWGFIRDCSKSLRSKLVIFDKGGHATQKEYWRNIAKLF